MDWNGRNVLVTGASGIVGSWLVKALLKKKARVVALVRDADPQSEFIRSGDINSTAVVSGCLEDYATLLRAINEYEVQMVFHLAAQAIVDHAYRSPLQTFESNIRGTYNLLEACRQFPQFVQGVVIASSDKAYGTSSVLPYTEDMALQGRAPYEVSKSCADLLAQMYSATYGLPVAIARCGNVYGGGDLNWSRIVPGTIRALLHNERPVLRSDGTFVRDYFYVKDTAEAYICLAEHVSQNAIKGQAFNFSDESPVSALQLVKKIQEFMDCTHLKPDIQGTAHHEIHSQFLSSAKARNLLGWRPKYSLEKGLTETIDWYRSFIGVRP